MIIKIRDKEAFMLFVVAFSLSFFIVMNGTHLLNKWVNQIAKKENEAGYNHTSIIELIASESEEGWLEIPEYGERMSHSKEITNQLWNRDMTSYIGDISLAVGKASEYISTDIVFSYRDEWYRSLQSGRYPNAQEVQQGNKMVVVGESILDYVEQLDGQDVLRIEGDIYEVIGVFENYSVTNYDDDILLFRTNSEASENSNIQNAIANRLAGFSLFLYFGSEKTTVENKVDSLREYFDGKMPYVVRLHEDIEEYSEEDNYAKIKAFILFLLFMIRMVNCSQVTKLWVARKQKDLLIMKTFGMSNRNIVVTILKELVQMLSVCVIVLLVLDVVYMAFIAKEMIIDYEYAKSGILLFVAVIIILFFAIKPVIKTIKETEPAKGLREL